MEKIASPTPSHSFSWVACCGGNCCHATGMHAWEGREPPPPLARPAAAAGWPRELAILEADPPAHQDLRRPQHRLTLGSPHEKSQAETACPSCSRISSTEAMSQNERLLLF